MSKELEALEFICKILSEKSIDLKWLFKEQYNTIKQALIKADKNKSILDELKTLVKIADSGSKKIISLAVLKNVLKDIL